jgi:hypothetical protein
MQPSSALHVLAALACSRPLSFYGSRSALLSLKCQAGVSNDRMIRRSLLSALRPSCLCSTVVPAALRDVDISCQASRLWSDDRAALPASRLPVSALAIGARLDMPSLPF